MHIIKYYKSPIFIIIILLIIQTAFADNTKAKEVINTNSLLNLIFKEFSNVKIIGTSSLISNDYRQTPSTVSLISNNQIKESVPRNLDELHDIYVQGFQFIIK